jgi:hypothetical protein
MQDVGKIMADHTRTEFEPTQRFFSISHVLYSRCRFCRISLCVRAHITQGITTVVLYSSPPPSSSVHRLFWPAWRTIGSMGPSGNVILVVYFDGLTGLYGASQLFAGQLHGRLDQ